MVVMDDTKGYLTGVWLGKDIELVRTGRFELLFFRDPKDQNSLEVIWSEWELSSNLFKRKVLGVCKYDGPCNAIKYAINTKSEVGESFFLANDNELNKKLGLNEYLMKIEGEKITLSGSQTSVVITGDKMLIEGNDLFYQELVKDEVITVSTEKLINPSLSSTSITDCLKMWHMGSFLLYQDGPCLQINTSKHMYIFYVSKSQIYCRAARYATCDKGVVFSQNFRIFQSGNAPKQTYMAENNLIASRPIQIIEELFNPTECTFTTNNNLLDIYWSVKSTSEDEITLNGCGGEDYYWYRFNSQIIEYFMLQK